MELVCLVRDPSYAACDLLLPRASNIKRMCSVGLFASVMKALLSQRPLEACSRWAFTLASGASPALLLVGAVPGTCLGLDCPGSWGALGSRDKRGPSSERGQARKPSVGLDDPWVMM